MLVCEHKHGSTNTCHAGCALDNLESGTKSVARCAESARDLSVGTFSLDDHTSEVERVLHQLASLLDGHALLLAKFCEQFGILLCLGVVQRVDDSGLVDVVEVPLLCEALQLVGVADKNKVGEVVGQYTVGSSKCALLCCFREHDALFVALCARNDVFK